MKRSIIFLLILYTAFIISLFNGWLDDDDIIMVVSRQEIVDAYLDENYINDSTD